MLYAKCVARNCASRASTFATCVTMLPTPAICFSAILVPSYIRRRSICVIESFIVESIYCEKHGKIKKKIIWRRKREEFYRKFSKRYKYIFLRERKSEGKQSVYMNFI